MPRSSTPAPWSRHSRSRRTSSRSGFLHLERISFSPDGIERGELVYSLPLAPGEEVSLEHKEWATTTEEFERITTESLEEFSEEGVTETSELAQSTNVQTQHSMGLNTNVTASGGFGPVNVTSSVGLSISDSASKTAEYSRNQSMAVTRKASTRSQKEHKVSFKVVTTSGTADQTVRTIKNPYLDKATPGRLLPADPKVGGATSIDTASG